jgi:hypothetical protein
MIAHKRTMDRSVSATVTHVQKIHTCQRSTGVFRLEQRCTPLQVAPLVCSHDAATYTLTALPPSRPQALSTLRQMCPRCSACRPAARPQTSTLQTLRWHAQVTRCSRQGGAVRQAFEGTSLEALQAATSLDPHQGHQSPLTVTPGEGTSAAAPGAACATQISSLHTAQPAAISISS